MEQSPSLSAAQFVSVFYSSSTALGVASSTLDSDLSWVLAAAWRLVESSAFAFARIVHRIVGYPRIMRFSFSAVPSLLFQRRVTSHFGLLSRFTCFPFCENPVGVSPGHRSVTQRCFVHLQPQKDACAILPVHFSARDFLSTSL